MSNGDSAGEAPERGPSSAVGGQHPARAAVLGFVIATAAIAIAGLIGSAVGPVGRNLGAIAAVVFLVIPYYYAARHGQDLYDYGFRSQPLGLGLKLGFGIPVIVFPLFFAGFVFFYEVVCQTDLLAALAPPGMCRLYGGWGELHMPPLTWRTLELLFIQIVVVALPEELFFRGFVLQLLERALPPKRRLWGGGVGLALVVSSALFALGHLAVSPDPRRLAVFFPGLMFGWVFSKTRSVLAGTIIHALSNVFIHLLEKAF
ncbi:MAG: CPBP family intramembrane metalloprotease [Deltaproteobacteria bacterium]|jgi:membrane protease YdiL (CAAX protease family)|nr:CPBP family intramembrane metalloprotease [Deltaproteobacteria bacterium]